jgi:hypothetical protein
MTTKPPADAAITDKDEPSNVLVETIGTRIKVRTAICSGVLSFGITQAEADALVKAGTARIIGTL